MNITSAATGPRSISGWARMAATTRRPTLEPGQLGERVSAAVERQGERRNAAAVDRHRHLVEAHACGRGDLEPDLLLQRMGSEPVVVGLEAAGAADGEKARVLARAVVLDRRRVGSGLEVGLGRGRVCEERAHGVELLRQRPVRGAGDRELAVVDVGSRAGERQRLERLRRRAEKGEEARRRRPRRRSGRRAPQRREPCAGPRRRRHGSPRPGSGRPLQEHYVLRWLIPDWCTRGWGA